ncbi:putative membrane protein [Xenococcus sp. PCC 7305]|uniref:glycosyltransferase family 39 protein n=1 Tax=Xenococcus sp. PCC 7305 TaxID=102125 RepID=UPI0002AC307E|nr:glycosyltransferase family 39 protein [Xenococcus sp. PCC 7305]ELS00395.1 putative membrane protein [Xenococcus sp. PCC 7305]
MSLKNYPKLFSNTRIILLVIILLLGIFFRFANLGAKIFWVDEVATAVRVSGYTIPEVTNNLQQQDILEANALRNYQIISPDKTFSDSFNALTKSPEHAPLYFILTRFWMQLWGSSISNMRSLSVCLSLLVFPCLYWLCQELFNKPLVSWLAVMLMSVSPFYVAYAQEARPYSLWTITILLMGASFLRAIRLNTWQSWLLYSFSLILGFYTSLFSIYIAFFQGLYLVIITAPKQIKIIRNYLGSGAIALLAFSPWIAIIINYLGLFHDNTSWMRGNFNIFDIVAVLIGTNLLTFGDLPISQDSNPIQLAIVLILIVTSFLVITLSSDLRHFLMQNKRLIIFFLLFIIPVVIILFANYIYLDWVTIIGALVALCILSLSGYALYFLVVNTSRDRWLFLLTLSVSVPISLIVTDIINQGQSSTAPRYLIPLQLGIQIAVAYCLASNLTFNKLTAIARQNFWKLTTMMFLTLGVFSCVRNLTISPFYQKGRNINNPAIAQIINQYNSALVLVEPNNAMDVLSLAYSLSPKTKFKVINSEDNLMEYINIFEGIFIVKASAQLQDRIAQNSQVNFEKVYQSHLFSLDEIPLDLWLLH